MRIIRPTQATVKRLYALSGNRCTFPECSSPLVEPDSAKVTDHICYIKAQSAGAPPTTLPLARRTRWDPLASLRALASVLAAKGGEKAIAETFCTIQDVGCWWL